MLLMHEDPLFNLIIAADVYTQRYCDTTPTNTTIYKQYHSIKANTYIMCKFCGIKTVYNPPYLHSINTA